WTGLAAVIVGACPTGALEMIVNADDVSIPALGLHCVPQQLDPASVEAIADLLDAADSPGTPPPDPDPLTLFPPRDLEGDETSSERQEPVLQLRLLGPVTAEGADLRPQQLALL